MEDISIVFLKQFTDRVERILHSPCYSPSKILEMALVIDESICKEYIEKTIPTLLKRLKMHSEVFANVRLNIVNWKADEDIKNNVVPMSMAMIPSYYDRYEQNDGIKTYEKLMEYLKLFQARSKLIIVITDGKYQVDNEDNLKKIMQPFLHRKVMEIVVENESIRINNR